MSAKIEAAEPKLSDERWLSASSAAAPPKRSTLIRDRHGERADPSQITRLAVKDIGYQQRGFQWEKGSIKVYLHAQPVDIAQGVVSAGNKGAGDPGIMFGYACRETPELMPGPIHFAYRDLKSWHVNPTGKFVGLNSVIGGADRRSTGMDRGRLIIFMVKVECPFWHLISVISAHSS